MLVARVNITTLSVGGISIHNVDALIAKPGTAAPNLLGRTFLDRLDSYTVEHDQLVMRLR